jgi:hypothetical protein
VLWRNVNCLVWKHERSSGTNSLTHSLRGVEEGGNIDKEKIRTKKQHKRKIGTKRKRKWGTRLGLFGLRHVERNVDNAKNSSILVLFYV